MCYPIFRWAVMGSFIIAIVSCNDTGEQKSIAPPASKKEESIAPQLNTPFPLSKKEQFLAIDQYSLGRHIKDIDLRNFKEYGAFYLNRLKIYHIGNLKAIKENKYITEVYLFFIDNILCNVETIMTKDMSNRFLIQYGKCTLRPHDRFNKQYIKNEGALVHSNGRPMLNPDLTNFSMKWEKPDFNIYFKVREPNIDQLENITDEIKDNKSWKYLYEPEYRYHIQVKNYNEQLSTIQYSIETTD